MTLIPNQVKLAPNHFADRGVERLLMHTSLCVGDAFQEGDTLFHMTNDQAPQFLGDIRAPVAGTVRSLHPQFGTRDEPPGYACFDPGCVGDVLIEFQHGTG